MSHMPLDSNAIEQWRRAIRRDVTSGYHFAMGNALLIEGDPVAAIEHYRRAIEADPEHGGALHNLVLAFERTERREEAARARETLVGTGMDGAMGSCGIGETLEGRGRYGEAEQAYREALAIRDTLAEAHLRLGTLQLRAGRHDEAAESLWRAYANDPEIVTPSALAGQMFLAVAGLRAANGSPEAIIRHTERALSIAPDHLDGLMFLAQARLGADRSDSRIGRIGERILALNPAHSPGWIIRSDFKRIKGAWTEALTAASRAMTIDPALPLPRLYYARANILMDRLDEAEALYGSLLRTHPGMAEVKADMAVLLFRRGRRKEAIAMMEEATGQPHPSRANWLKRLDEWRREARA